MRKNKLSDGTPFLGIKIEHFVTKSIFAKAMAGYCFETGNVFDPKTTKTKVMAMLRVELILNGNHGIYTEHWDSASEEFVKPFNNAYTLAIIWIEKNYPYLK